MSLVVFLLLAALAAIAIAYPLLTPPTPAQPQPEARITDAQVEGAVLRVRQARKRSSLAVPPGGGHCPACSTPYQPGDLFCARCGQPLPQQETAPTPAQESVCPSCSAVLRKDDVFCARCGCRLDTPIGGGSLEEDQS